jgi:hypothetical protein
MRAPVLESSKIGGITNRQGIDSACWEQERSERLLGCVPRRIGCTFDVCVVAAKHVGAESRDEPMDFAMRCNRMTLILQIQRLEGLIYRLVVDVGVENFGAVRARAHTLTAS